MNPIDLTPKPRPESFTTRPNVHFQAAAVAAEAERLWKPGQGPNNVITELGDFVHSEPDFGPGELRTAIETFEGCYRWWVAKYCIDFDWITVDVRRRRPEGACP